MSFDLFQIIGTIRPYLLQKWSYIFKNKNMLRFIALHKEISLLYCTFWIYIKKNF